MFLLIYNRSSAQVLNNCSSCSVSEIKMLQLSGLSVDEIRFLICEISARKGYRFEQPQYQEYFEAQSWYKPNSIGKEVRLNVVERKNVGILKEYLGKLKKERYALVIQFQKFKTLILAGNQKELKDQFGFTYENIDHKAGIEKKLLKEIFSKIKLTDINYYKHNGLNSVTIDNGFAKILYELSITGTSVNLTYNYMNHSKIIKAFDQFNRYRSEDEFMYNWQFNFKNGRLMFVRLAVAG